jgi:hypothetical protein
LNGSGEVVDAGGNPVTGGGATTVDELTDAGATGKAIVKAADQATAQTAIGLSAAITARIDNTAGLGSSTTNAPSQGAVKAYVDGILDANNAYQYKGVIDCSGNPNYPAASAGHTYKVSVAGKIGGAAGPNVEVGDSLVCLVDGTAAGTQAAVGANWIILQTNVDGAVVGPSSATSGNVATFSGGSGKVIQDSGKALPAGTIAGTTDAQTFTNKRIQPRVVAMADGATITPAGDTTDIGTVTIAGNRTIAAPSGTPVDGQTLALRITQDATGSRTLAWNAIYSFPFGTPVLQTPAGSVDYLHFRYSSALSKWVLQSDGVSKAYVDAGLNGKIDDNDPSAITSIIPGLTIMVTYNAGWTLPAGFSTNPNVGWHFVGGDDTHQPPATTSTNRIWDEPA